MKSQRYFNWHSNNPMAFLMMSQKATGNCINRGPAFKRITDTIGIPICAMEGPDCGTTTITIQSLRVPTKNGFGASEMAPNGCAIPTGLHGKPNGVAKKETVTIVDLTASFIPLASMATTSLKMG